MMERKERRRGFVWIDWVILVALLLGGALVGYRIRASRAAATPSQPIVYTLLISTEERDFEDLIPIGASVTSANGTARLGKVLAISTRPSRAATVRDGRVVFVALPDRVELLVTVRADAVVREGDGLRVGDIRIAVGSAGDFRLGGYLAEGAQILSVRKGEG